MTHTKTGGPAFPGGHEGGSQGLTLRDYLAAKAMPACARMCFELRHYGPDTPRIELPWAPMAAKCAYELADAMLKEREK